MSGLDIMIKVYYIFRILFKAYVGLWAEPLKGTRYRNTLL